VRSSAPLLPGSYALFSIRKGELDEPKRTVVRIL
jgi:hypothetical protein